MNSNYLDLGNPLADHPLNKGLVSWWLPLSYNFNGFRLYDLNKRFDGTFANQTTWGSGLLPEFPATSFNSANSDNISFGTSINTFLSGTAFSFAALINLSGSGTRTIIRNDNGSGGVGTGFGFRVNGGIEMEVYPALNTTTGGTTLSNNVWYHVAGTYSGGNAIRVYLNGVQDGVNTTSIQASTSAGGGTLYHGTYGAGDYFSGKMAGVSAWNRVLSASEVQQHYFQCRTGYPDLLEKGHNRRYFFLEQTVGHSTDMLGLAPRQIDLGNPVADHPLNYGLVGWWMGLPNNSGGDTFFNLLGKYHGSFVNTPAWSGDEKAMPAIQTNGFSSYVDCGSNFPVTNYPITIECTFLYYSHSSLGQLVIIKNSGDNHEFDLFTNGGNVRLHVYDGTDDEIGTTNNINGGWNHAVAVFESATSRSIYLNGADKTTDTTSRSPVLTNAVLTIGAFPSQNRYFGGLISYVKIYNRALSDSEVGESYKQWRSGHQDTLRSSRKIAYGVEPPPVSIPKDLMMLAPRRIDLGNPVADHPLNYGLAGWWMGLPNNSGGNTFFDLLGKYHASFVNTPSWSGDQNGRSAVSTDGSGSYLTTASGFPVTDYPITIECSFVYYGHTTSGFIARVNDGNHGFGIYTNGGTVRAHVYDGTNDEIATTKTINSGWNHAVAVFESSTSRSIFLNGVDKTTDTTSRSPVVSSATVVIGAFAAQPWFFGGLIGHVKIYNRALSDTEVSESYKQWRSGHQDTLRRLYGNYFISESGGTQDVVLSPLRLPDLDNPVSDHPLNYGLKGWWMPLRNNSGGSQLFDLLKRYPATLEGDALPTWNATQPSGDPAVRYISSGGTCFATCTNFRSPTTAFTWSCYALAYSWSADANTLMSHGSQYVLFDFRNVGGYFWAADGPFGVDMGVSSALDLNRWYHFTLVREGDNVTGGYKYYVNGLLTGSTDTGSGLSFSTDLKIGGRSGFNQSWDGIISSAAVYDRALSPSEIYQLYQESVTGYPNTLRRRYVVPSVMTVPLITTTGPAFQSDTFQNDAFQASEVSSYSYQASGSLSLGNSATSELIISSFSYSASGKLSLAGTSTTQISLPYAAAGTVRLSGSATLGWASSYSTSGNLTLGSSATVQPSYLYVTSGSLRIGNSATAQTNYSYDASGGLNIGNSADVSVVIPGYSYTASGSLSFTGSASVSPTYSYAASGRLSINSSATVLPKYLVQKVQSKGGTGNLGNPLVLTFDSPTTTGNLIVVNIAFRQPASVITFAITDNSGNTYSVASAVSSPGAFSRCAEISYCINASGGSGHQITVTPSASSPIWAVVIDEYSGLKSSPLDASSNTKDGFGTTFTSGNTSTLAQPDELVVGCLFYSGSLTPVEDTSYTRNLIQGSCFTQYKVVVSSSPVAALWTVPTNDSYGAAVATFSARTTANFQYSASGGLGFSNAAAAQVSYQYSPSGNLRVENSATTQTSYYFIASGTLSLSGNADIQPAYLYTTSGGLNLNESAQVQAFYSMQTGGTLSLGNSAPVQASYAYQTSGLLTLDNSAQAQTSYTYQTSGLISLAGSASVNLTYSATASGGLNFNESASKQQLIERTASGGIGLAGSADVRTFYNYTASGSLLIGNSAIITQGDASHTASGGISLSGSAIVTAYYSYVTSGSLSTGNTSQSYPAFARVSLGGMSFGGSAQYQLTLPYVATGTCRTGNTSPASFGLSYAASGRLITSNAAQTTNYLTYAASGTLSTSGSAQTQLTTPFTCSGKATLGGAAQVNFTCSYVASGRLSTGNSSTSALTHAYQTSGNLSLGNASSVRTSYLYQASGNLSLSGSFDVFGAGYQYTPTSGVSLSGSATVTASYAHVASGKLNSGNSATCGLVVSANPSGRLSTSGSATSSFTLPWIASGNLSLSGSAQPNIYLQSQASGKCTFGNSAAVTLISIFQASGSCSLGGSATVRPTYLYSGSGNLSLGGSAPVTTQNIAFNVTGSGTTSLSGSAVVVPTYLYTTSGSLRAGNTSAAAMNLNYQASGDLETGGASSATPVLRYSASGRMGLVGIMDVEYRLSYFASGVVRASGSAGVQVRYLYETSGKMTLGNGSTVRLSLSYSASGVLDVDGAANAACSFFSYLAGGGLSKQSIFEFTMRLYYAASGGTRVGESAVRQFIMPWEASGCLTRVFDFHVETNYEIPTNPLPYSIVLRDPPNPDRTNTNRIMSDRLRKDLNRPRSHTLPHPNQIKTRKPK